ncbi:hypothetical protein ACFQV2_14730 [Actinokineospora soli]|uniref:Glyoxalase/Bleomycin resistance protein/Dioxygenase superfamily protein n=1 Tax=Actinokineospora soli TaxID=1048753 RepID=A0ABW2TLH6_9PSEU
MTYLNHPSHESAPEGVDYDSIPDMPNFAVLLVSDLEKSLEWYIEGLGFWIEKTLTGPDGLPR